MNSEKIKGVISATGAYVAWGFIPIYFKLLDAISAGELLVHRVIWSSMFLALTLLLLKKLGTIKQHFRCPRTLLLLSASAAFIATNWTVFIWASNHDHLIDTSIGYYINPLINVFFGLVFLGERLRKLQWVAVTLAFAGVAIQIITLGKFPIISLTLAFAFGAYGLMRKLAAVGAMEGLLVEMLLLLLPALIFFTVFSDMRSLTLAKDSAHFLLLLVAAGPITSIPLLLFAAGVARLKYSTIGFIQYLAPSIVLITAVLIYHETLVWQKQLTFVFIWVGLAVYSVDAWRQTKTYHL